MNDKNLVVVRGAGDLATGIIQKLWRSGFRVVALEIPEPTTIRRHVALSTALRNGKTTVEDITAVHAKSIDELESIWANNEVPIMADPEGNTISLLKPAVVVDAIIAKRNLGTHRDMAPLTIGLGPGFSAPEDVTAVIETMRGHNLGRLITNGHAIPDTGTPGLIGGEGVKRVVHTSAGGTVKHNKKLGDIVTKGDILFWVDDVPVTAHIDGVLRGLIEEGLTIPKGLKSADVDPRMEVKADVNTISDKARCLGGAVLEAILYLQNKGE